MKFALASHNAHKIAELRELLSKHLPSVEMLSLDDIGFVGDIDENGTTYEENALIKARAAAGEGRIGLGDDSGLSVDALGGAPGIYSARYALTEGYAGGHDDAANNRLLIERLAGRTGAERSASFVCCIAAVFPDGRELVVRGEAPGRILADYRGGGGFGYDPLFYYEPMGKTFSEMTPEEKNAVSHRGRAIVLLAEKLKEFDRVK